MRIVATKAPVARAGRLTASSYRRSRGCGGKLPGGSGQHPPDSRAYRRAGRSTLCPSPPAEGLRRSSRGVSRRSCQGPRFVGGGDLPGPKVLVHFQGFSELFRRPMQASCSSLVALGCCRSWGADIRALLWWANQQGIDGGECNTQNKHPRPGQDSHALRAVAHEYPGQEGQ